MTFQEWYNTIRRGRHWYGVSADYEFDMLAEKAWQAGVNSCKNLQKVLEVIKELSARHQVVLLAELAKYFGYDMVVN